ncbi:MAG: SDR family NAD(P)-dependent oxidoreductase [Pseudomonadota bacterium]
MTRPTFQTALIVGAGAGLSGSLARLFAGQGLNVALASRQPDRLADLATETGAKSFTCDVSQADQVETLFAEVDDTVGVPDLVVFNPSARSRGPIVDIVPADVERALAVTAYGGFLVGQQAARRMVANNQGAILFTGASASVKGYPQSAPFAMGKFALRGLAQSMARELGPKGVHVAHFVIDGGILPPGREQSADRPDSMLHPDAIAETYWQVARQDRSAWTWEVELRPWVESF